GGKQGGGGEAAESHRVPLRGAYGRKCRGKTNALSPRHGTGEPVHEPLSVAKPPTAQGFRKRNPRSEMSGRRGFRWAIAGVRWSAIRLRYRTARHANSGQSGHRRGARGGRGRQGYPFMA